MRYLIAAVWLIAAAQLIDYSFGIAMAMIGVVIGVAVGYGLAYHDMTE